MVIFHSFFVCLPEGATNLSKGPEAFAMSQPLVTTTTFFSTASANSWDLWMLHPTSQTGSATVFLSVQSSWPDSFGHMWSILCITKLLICHITAFKDDLTTYINNIQTIYILYIVDVSIYWSIYRSGCLSRYIYICVCVYINPYLSTSIHIFLHMSTSIYISLDLSTSVCIYHL